MFCTLIVNALEATDQGGTIAIPVRKSFHWKERGGLGVRIVIADGIFFRTVIGLHSTWLVNSATHMWGTQRFPTGDTSKNSFWVALLTFGEGWHNNHAHPQAARHGVALCELDFNWYGIFVLRALGLVRDVKVWIPTVDEGRKAEVPRGLAA